MCMSQLSTVMEELGRMKTFNARLELLEQSRPELLEQGDQEHGKAGRREARKSDSGKAWEWRWRRDFLHIAPLITHTNTTRYTYNAHSVPVWAHDKATYVSFKWEWRSDAWSAGAG